MKTLKFEGSSDDTFGEYGITDEGVDNCGSGKPIQCLIEAEGEKLLVVGQYCDYLIGAGCWVVGASMYDEDNKMPSWPIRLHSGDCPYSPVLEVDVPDSFALTWYSNGREI